MFPTDPFQPLLSIVIVGLALVLYCAASVAVAFFWGRVFGNRDQNSGKVGYDPKYDNNNYRYDSDAKRWIYIPEEKN